MTTIEAFHAFFRTATYEVQRGANFGLVATLFMKYIVASGTPIPDVEHCPDLAELLAQFPAVERARMDAGQYDMVYGNVGDDGIEYMNRTARNRERFAAAKRAEDALYRKICETRLRHQIWSWIIQNNQDGRYAPYIEMMVMCGYTSDVYPWTSAYPSTRQPEEAGAEAEAEAGAGAGADEVSPVDNLKQLCAMLSEARAVLSEAHSVSQLFENELRRTSFFVSSVELSRLWEATRRLNKAILSFLGASSPQKRAIEMNSLRTNMLVAQNAINTVQAARSSGQA